MPGDEGRLCEPRNATGLVVYRTPSPRDHQRADYCDATADHAARVADLMAEAATILSF